MGRVANLYRLQTIDSRLDVVHSRLRAVHAALKETSELDRAQRDLTAADAAMQHARRNLRQTEDAVRDQTAKISDVEQRLYSGKVRNPKELQDLQRDLESLKRHKSTLEDRQLEAMEAVEAAEAAHSLATARRTTAEGDAERIRGKLFTDEKALEADLQRWEAEREAAESGVPLDDRADYARLRQRKHGVAVSRLTDGVCGSCGVAPEAARIQNARQDDTPIHCGNCERILYAAS